MLSHDECLKKIREEHPGQAVWCSVLLQNGLYQFTLSIDEKVIPGDLQTQDYLIDPNNGKIRRFDLNDQFEMTPEELKQYGSVKDSMKWIEAKP